MSGKAIRGQWVKIHRIILNPSQRAPSVPEDTKKCPLEMWLNGYLDQDEAMIGEEVIIKTVIGRSVNGTLTEIEPKYAHSFGKPIQELLEIGPKVRDFIEQGDIDER
ncbi:MAG TPA: 2-amino-4-oxopentanoate thiolase subunit OrtA [Thermotogota bacterium]|nr:2-amino-4-oxopentanoate thiolase subunit OrtA [Thermotogota bacterium]HRW34540.1 2-amino-4-oxopentanoate thiolase subunit OrtA [Thermotogota bacterium]